MSHVLRLLTDWRMTGTSVNTPELKKHVRMLDLDTDVGINVNSTLVLGIYLWWCVILKNLACRYCLAQHLPAE